MATAGNITAVLTLNATNFDSGLEKALGSIEKFKGDFSKSVGLMSADLDRMKGSLEVLGATLSQATNRIDAFSVNAKSLSQFSTYASAVNRLANALKILSSETIDVDRGMNTINNMFKAFQGVLQGTEVKVRGVISSIESLNRESKSTVSSFEQSKAELNQWALTIQRTNTIISDTEARLRYLKKVAKETFNPRDSVNLYRDNLMQLALGVEAYNSIEAKSTYQEHEHKKALDQVAQSDERLSRIRQNLATTTNQQALLEERLALSTEKDAMSKDKATQSTNRYANANKGLSRSFSMLRSGITLVGSMLAYNFIHNLAMATTETINAKSEMNGYFQMLGYSTSQVADFNKELDKTVAKFPRLNKYALGETISSIGVEFELTTAEMKKAMPVVSMITSEYLRAGRNVNEASLAVKDILQGEFQRLSRETGVKGDQLKATGLWSGDKTDVMGLLKALDKVGKDRNWDIFVTKANSLNDAVLIMQNRFSEWSADMVEKVQPTIVNAFNQIMTVAQLLAPVVNGAFEWLSGDGIAQSIVKWGGLATAISSVTVAMIHQRTGAGLLQIAQMGLKDSIIATALGLDAEVVATEGSTFAIAQRITGLEAETLSTIGSKTAILSKILGLEMETVAEYELSTAMWSAILGIEAETVATEGVTASLLANKVALAGVVLEATALIGVLGVLAFAFGGLAIEVMENTEKMKAFHELSRNGKQILADYDDSVDGLKTHLKELKATQKQYTKGSKEYANVGKAVKKVEDDINLALDQRRIVKEAINKSEKAQKDYNAQREEARLEYERQINEAIVQTGVSTETANILSNTYLRDANNGAELLSKSLKRIQQDYRSSASGIVEMTSKMEELGYTTGEIEEQVNQLATANDFIIKGEIQMAEAENLTEYLSGWLTKQYGEVTITLKNFQFEMDEGDVVGAFAGVWKGVTYGIAGIFGKTPDEVREITEAQGGWDWSFVNALMPFDDIDHLLGELGQIIINTISQWDLGKAFIDLLGSLTDGEIGATDKGKEIAEWLGNGLNEAVNNIPILGDVKQLLESVTQSSDDTNTKFQQNAQNITNNAISMASNVTSSFSGMKNNHKTIMETINTNNSTAFNDMKNKTNISLLSMRDSTSQTTQQMTGAWGTMKDSIIASAKKISDGTTAHFNTLGSNIGNFYRNLQNPANWGTSLASGVAKHFGGAGYRSWSRTPRPATTRSLMGKRGAGVNPYTPSSKKMGIKELVEMVGSDERVDVNQFLALFSGGFGGWDYSSPHISHIKRTANEWMTAPAVIGRFGSVGNGYKVGRFANGTPSFSFSEFESTASGIFSQVPYKFYYNSDWKGNWLNALLSGAVNCSDGADALISLARVFGFDGYKQHTTLGNGVGHFYAVINGRAMDTTNFQQHGSWSPLGGAGTIPVRHSRGAGSTVSKTTINIDMTGSTFYGEDDFKEQLREASREVLREDFNDPFTIAL